MSSLGCCEHCGVPKGTASERLYFKGVGREIEFVLCEWCREEFRTEDGITLLTPKA